MVKKKTFEKWVNDYHDRIYATIFHIVGNEDDALDCTQEVFLKAYKKRGAFRGEASPYTWLYRIANNHALNFVSRNRTKTWDTLQERGQEADTEDDTAQMRSFRREWLQHLSKTERRVIEVRVFERKSFREVAERLNTTENSAKVLYHRAVKKLQQVVK